MVTDGRREQVPIKAAVLDVYAVDGVVEFEADHAALAASFFQMGDFLRASSRK